MNKDASVANLETVEESEANDLVANDLVTISWRMCW